MDAQLRVLIVDDEPLARRRLRRLLARHADVAVVGEAEDAPSAVAAVSMMRPDILVLDIQMPGGDGFSLLESLDVAPMPFVIFATAHATHAVHAFDAGAVDFLLKPIEDERLALSLARARTAMTTRHRETWSDTVRAELRALVSAVTPPAAAPPPLAPVQPPPRYLHRIAVPTGRRTVFLRVAEIDWIAAEGNYVRLHAAGRQFLVRAGIGAVESQLDPAMFARIHRSTIVNVDRITELRTLTPGEYRAVLTDGTQLEVHRAYRARLPHSP